MFKPLFNRLLQVSFLLTVFLFAGAAGAKAYINNKIHKSTHLIAFAHYSKCSGIAIGPHAFMTGHHCGSFVPIEIDGLPVKMQEVFDDEHDHVIMYLSGITFKDYVHVHLHDAEVGDRVFMYGNPSDADLVDQFREGYVSGVQLHAGSLLQVYVMPVIPGDSGSMIFDSYGRMVGELTYSNGPFALSFRINFSKQDFKDAQNYNGSVQPFREMCNPHKCIAIPDGI